MTFIYRFQNRNRCFMSSIVLEIQHTTANLSGMATLKVHFDLLSFETVTCITIVYWETLSENNWCFSNNNYIISVAFIKYKHNIVIPKEHGLVTNRQNHYSFTKHTQFPINLWPTSRTKHVTIIPILISNEFASVYISELENTINSLTSQAGCVEFLPISPAEVRSFTNWIRIEPGKMDILTSCEN